MDLFVFKVAIDWKSNLGSGTYTTSVLANSKWQAIEKAITRYRDIQPDRAHYKIVSKWTRESAQCIAILAMQAYNHTMNLS